MGIETYSKSLKRAITIIKCFNPEETELSGANISRKTGMHKATVHRILSTLSAERLLEKDVETGKYRIGPDLYFLGNLYLVSKDICVAAEPVIRELNELTKETTNVAIFEGGYITVIMREEAKYPFRFHTHIGSVFPAYAVTMGRALLSELSDSEIDELYPEEKLEQKTKKTIATKTELKRELEQVRRTGVANTREQYFEGIESFASVIRNSNGKAAAATSIVVPIMRMNKTKREQFVVLVKKGAGLISYRLGYQDKRGPTRDIEEIRSWWEQNKINQA